MTRGDHLYAAVRDLYPVCRSLTGTGIRQTLAYIADRIPLQIHEVPTGTPVLDWEIPKEWNIRGARIETLDGDVVIDFRNHNLHVVGYSQPIDRVVTRSELAAHLHTLPDQPDLIPYRTSYYRSDWGFCLTHRQWEAMQDEQYRVVVDSTLTAGSMSYGEAFIPGYDEGEILIVAHCCHPSLANDNLSGIAIATELAATLLDGDRPRLGHRFLFIPGTIGSITWLARNEPSLHRIRHGLVLSCLGDRGRFHYKQSRRGNAVVDRAARYLLSTLGKEFEILPFSPYGYDERQFCSPGYNLPVGSFMRSPHGSFPEYHTSGDNLDLVSPEALAESFEILHRFVTMLDQDATYLRVDGRGEPQLGSRGLYRTLSGQKEGGGDRQMALLWVLNLADGQHSLLDMAERADLPFELMRGAAELAREAGLIFEVDALPVPAPASVRPEARLALTPPA